MNEYSARYSILDNEFCSQARASGRAEPAEPPGARRGARPARRSQRVFDLLKRDAEPVYAHYMEMLNEARTGSLLDPERLAWRAKLRMNLSLGSIRSGTGRPTCTT